MFITRETNSRKPAMFQSTNDHLSSSNTNTLISNSKMRSNSLRKAKGSMGVLAGKLTSAIPRCLPTSSKSTTARYQWPYLAARKTDQAQNRQGEGQTQNPRGSRCAVIKVPEDDMSDGALNLEEEIEAAIFNAEIKYPDKIQTSDGYRTCQDMATAFVNKVSFLNEDALKVVHCFLNCLKYNVDQKFGEKHWVEERPNEIIDVVNDMCRYHEKIMEKFPLSKEVLISMVYVLFRWMYKSKWTDHKLIRRSNSKCIS